MTKYELSQLKTNLEGYLLKYGVDTHKNTMNCPICGDKDGFHFVPQTNRTMWKCFSAKHSTYSRDSGDIFELIAQLDNIDYAQAIEKVADMYNYGHFEDIKKAKTIQKVENPKPQKDRTNFYNMALQRQDKAIEYLRKVRGYVHAEELAKRFQIGYVPEYAYEFENNQATKKTPAVIIPSNAHSYAWRSITEPIKKKSGEVVPFNMECLQDITKKWIFLVEGEFDCMAILDIALDTQNCDFSCISVNSANNLPRFMEDICKDIPEGMGLIIALDNDAKEETHQAIKKYQEIGLNVAMSNQIACIVADVKSLYLNQKDANDALRHNRDEFLKAINNTLEKAQAVDMAQYMSKCNDLINQSTKQPTEPFIPYAFNYIGQIDRAFDLCYNHLRYCHQTKTWYSYNGIRLEHDITEKFINTLHKQIDKQILTEMEHFKTLNNEEILKNAKKEHKTAISKVGLYNTVEGIKRREPIAITLLELDKSNLLNCEDVTLDLDCLTLHEHTIEDLCTKLAPTKFKVPLNPQYVEHWNKFILDIMCEDTSMAEFIQRVCGYCLFPTNREECFFILYGATTRNGKSTLLESIKAVLGDYAKAVSSATLSEKPTGKEANQKLYP